MSADNKDSLTKIIELAGKIAMELVYAEPGKDIGLLPVNCLLDQIEEISSSTPMPPPLPEAIKLGRHWVDNIFATTGLFDAETLRLLGEWSNWLTSALEATIDGREFAPLPKAWEADSDGPRATPAAPSPATPAAPAAAAPPVAAIEEMPLVVNIDQDAELLREYISESHEHLQNIELGVLVLEDNPSDAETLASIFRAFHTFKGGSGLLNLTAVNRLAHDLESLLDLARQGKLAIDSVIINLILEGGDALKQYTVAIEAQLNGTQAHVPIMVPTAQLIRRVQAVVQATQSGAPLPVLERPQAAAPAPAPAPVNTPAETALKPKTASVEPAEPPPVAAKSAEGAGVASTSSPMVKVATPKLDSLVDLVGEMVIAQSLVTQDPSLRSVASGTLARNLTQLSRITEELQKTAMSLRMVPIRSTFQKMTRLVRDLASKQGKQVELKLRGEDTELDRTIVEQLNDPLVHMIRNAVDHGIEKPDLRTSRGKPTQGTIELNAFHQGGNIVIEISDNGGGLNRERILAKGIEKGLVQAGENLTDAEIYQLIFAPGFSTAETVSDVSGRGVGMDVVHRNIEKLRGKVEIQTRLGQGSTFTIFLPLTLAIIDGLMVAVGEQRYIIPTLMVRESFRPTASMISSVHERGEMVSVRGRLSPMLRLYEYFDIEPQAKDPTQGIIVVVGSDHENRCLMVDQLIGKQEVVIKSLGETFKQNRALAGAAILGDGRVGLILDVDYLLRLKNETVKKAA